MTESEDEAIREKMAVAQTALQAEITKMQAMTARYVSFHEIELGDLVFDDGRVKRVASLRSNVVALSEFGDVMENGCVHYINPLSSNKMAVGVKLPMIMIKFQENDQA